MDDCVLEELLKAAGYYAQATGLPCRAIDRDGKNLTPRPSHTEDAFSGCEFCSSIRQYAGEFDRDCSRVHRYGSYQAERFGGVYIYFCSNTLIHWVAPVVMNNEIVASLLGGPALMVDPDDYFTQDILSRFVIPPEKIPRIRAVLESIPFISPSRAQALSELLRMTALTVSSHVSDVFPGGQDERNPRPGISGTIRDIKPVYKPQQRRPVYPVAKEKELLSMIGKGDRIGAQAVLNEILGFIFFSSGTDLQSVKIRVQELIVLLSRAAVEGGASISEVFGLNDRYLPELQHFNSVDDIAGWLSTILKRFSDCVFVLKSVKHADLIQKTVRHIHTGYYGHLSLESVSAYIGLSPSYFSRVFKDGMGVSFVEYLTRVRVEKSKLLLRDRTIPLVDVAARSGFTDQSYFTKIFKRITGISPGKFRETGGVCPNPAGS